MNLKKALADRKHFSFGSRDPGGKVVVFGCLLIVLMFFSLFPEWQSPVLAEEKKNVLVLHSYHKEFPWTDSVHNGVVSVFHKSGLNLEIFVEYLDVKRHRADDSFPHLASLYAQRYRDINFDVIIVSDDFALDFVLQNRMKLFHSAPVVFCGINNFTERRIEGHSQVTGVTEEIDIRGTIELALSLHPGTGQIAVVNDGSTPAAMNMRLIRSVKPYFAGKVEFVELFDLSVEDLKAALGKLPKDTVVYHMHYYFDKASGQNLNVKQSFAVTRGSCDLPIYTGWDFQMGYGATGGVVINGIAQGRTAAEMAVKILGGQSPDEIPPLSKSPNTPMFDYDYMGRYGITGDDLPANSVILNEPVSFYYRYRTIIWFSAIFIVPFGEWEKNPRL